ncbi:MAG: Orn/Lys/Arg decarboxylase major region [Eubacterium sp.]|nr:Orn/Lys/Arg decarboxylase major region [Eubacterium sp.]
MKPIKKHNTPIYNYLRKYAEENINIFHMPGHKLGSGVPQELAQDLLQLDLTEVEGTDNLHYPEGIIQEAQELAARAFGADRTFFLVNGSTCGVQAAIMSVCARGQKLIVGRDAHKAVASGLILSGAEPVFVYPEFNEEFGISAEIKPEAIENALCANPDAAAVLITRPNYYGICSDIEKICSLVHSYGKILIVDEAHGAHFAFNDRLPQSALKHGADICIQSAHKTLPALTQGAYLHVKDERVNTDRLASTLSMLQTSSPSYIIMSYLDIARELMEEEGGTKLDKLIDTNARFREELEKTNVYKVLTGGSVGIKTIHDPTRLVVNIRKLGMSGYEADRILRDKYRTQIEMADNENLVMITTVSDSRDNLERLLQALKELSLAQSLDKEEAGRGAHPGILESHNLREILREKYKKTAEHQSAGIDMENRGVHSENLFARKPWEAYYAQKEQVSMEESCSRICADIITPYPPGIPLLYPGEIITASCIKYITDILDAGGKVNGIGYNKSIRVIRNS